MDIILASASRRRSQILESCGIKHKVVATAADEISVGKLPERLCILNACIKAVSALKKVRHGYIIGADTVVLLEKKIIGKPKDKKHARGMLKNMSGKTVNVYTGLCVVEVKKSKIIMDYEMSLVRTKKIKKDEISRYFELMGPYDKAGGFSIEGAGSFIFDDIRGSYFNVLGLPMGKLKEMCDKIGLDLLKYVKVTV